MLPQRIIVNSTLEKGYSIVKVGAASIDTESERRKLEAFRGEPWHLLGL